MNEAKVDHIADQQLKALLPEQKRAVFQFIGRLYQQNLEGENDPPNRVAVTFKHNTETNSISYQLACPLDKAGEMLEQAQNICSNLVEVYPSEDDELGDAQALAEMKTLFPHPDQI